MFDNTDCSSVLPEQPIRIVGKSGFITCAENGCIVVKPKWRLVESDPPPLSYVESDNVEDPYDAVPVLVYSVFGKDWSILVACREYDEEEQVFTWRQYIDGENGHWQEMIGCHIDYWMELPSGPEIPDSCTT